MELQVFVLYFLLQREELNCTALPNWVQGITIWPFVVDNGA